MRALNKKINLATEYRDWLAALGENEHPKYKSSTHYYYDIIAELLWIQMGVCAYSETFLIDKDRVKPENWTNGRYGELHTLGQLDHYDPRLKKPYGWRWDNFFMVHSDINTKVKRNNIIKLLKPDNPGYSPFYYLSYNIDIGIFFPNNERSDEEKLAILDDLKFLGINYPSIREMRKTKLSKLLIRLEYRDITLEQGKDELSEFFTAYEMAASQILMDN